MSLALLYHRNRIWKGDGTVNMKKNNQEIILCKLIAICYLNIIGGKAETYKKAVQSCHNFSK